MDRLSKPPGPCQSPELSLGEIPIFGRACRDPLTCNIRPAWEKHLVLKVEIWEISPEVLEWFLGGVRFALLFSPNEQLMEWLTANEDNSGIQDANQIQ